MIEKTGTFFESLNYWTLSKNDDDDDDDDDDMLSMFYKN